MYSVYLDDSYIKSTQKESIPLINAMGGIIIDDENEDKLVQIIKNEKGKYTHENLPIKWNFKDSEIQRVFKEFKRNSDYKNMLENSRNIRLGIIQKSLELNYKIVFSCIKSFSEKKKIVKAKKEDFSGILFENILYRIGNEAKYNNPGKYQIVMDWPTDANPQPYNRAYYYMYNADKTLSGNSNHCGPLCKLNLKQSVFYTKCTHSPCLQFSDLIVGAMKDYLEMSLFGSKESCVGKEAYDLFKDKIRNNSGKKLGYGIITPNGNTEFKDQLINIFDR